MEIDEADIKELDRLERMLNGERGIRCVRSMLTMLESGDYESAANIRREEGDKTRYYPELEPVLYRIFGCRLHNLKGCGNWLCETK